MAKHSTEITLPLMDGIVQLLPCDAYLCMGIHRNMEDDNKHEPRVKAAGRGTQ